MGHSKRLKSLHSILKDKAKIIKAKLSITNHTTTSIQIVVLRATTRTTQSPPHDHLISALILFGHTTRYSASACISTIVHRLHHHNQPNVYVALKSLITLHHMITSGSFVHKEQIVSVSNTGLGFLNLSRFVDNTDMQSREFSLWVHWYARFLETNLSVSNVLGGSLSLSKIGIEKKKENLRFSLYMDLFKEVEGLVSTIEAICTAPKSLHCQTNDIIYEVMRLVGEDYRMIQYHTMIRLTELSRRIHKFSDSELNDLTRSLERLKGCKGRLGELFVNRRRNVSFWDLVSELLTKLRVLEEDRGLKLVSWKMIEYATESTQLNKQIIIPSRPLELLPFGENNDWSSFEKVNQTFYVATA